MAAKQLEARYENWKQFNDAISWMQIHSRTYFGYELISNGKVTYIINYTLWN